jgi:diaminohydroxyphosphoribosylaminopyrimidine deaminase/5-amino-6-(5-phosphoribosylamino)uracil reductase
VTPSELMQRALAEAARATGRTRPNPTVGCVIAKGGNVIAVGHHARAGTHHAERVALDLAGPAARGADVYVTLEPCSHVGRTGPCCDALIEAGVGRVFVGTQDPNPLVDGRGIRRIRRAGIPVEVGLCADECSRLIESFAFAVVHRRAWVVAKIAQSLDGRVATRTGASKWITGPTAREFGHTLRNELDAILVGSGTVRADDPLLTCRSGGGRDPVRVVVDTQASISPKSRIVRAVKDSVAPTWIFCGHSAPARRRTALERAGAETIAVKLKGDRVDMRAVIAQLFKRELLSVLVEGGPTVLGACFDAKLVNRVYAFIAPLIIGGEDARSAVLGRGCGPLSQAARLTDVEFRSVGDDCLMTGLVG